MASELCEVSSFCSDCEFEEQQFFSLSKKRALGGSSTQEGMRYESPPVKARRMMPPTPLQNSNDTFEEEQVLLGADDQMWSAKERTIIAEVEEWKDLLGPEDVDVDFRLNLNEARNERGCEIFVTFSTDCLSEFLLANRSRWDKYKRKWKRTMETKFVGFCK